MTEPLFKQIAALIEDSIVDGTLGIDQRAPSTNELATFHRINPATARKGIALLIKNGVLYKRRGIGMFVSAQASAIIQERRVAAFAATYVAPLIDESILLGFSRTDIHALLDQVAESRGLYE
ncbi:GntR family transcriptional regulator [Corynebacterium crudilactis]|uniref:GntR family transcriptional regulator n=1 Tax=Corynebacterium crudilactis TaxID=1652495 RepID=A0A172QWL6_9CORY|nr:GntR family transcriptional regulator [Corynebacterium crudilactis]ANE05103.1 GntR family transcriptional regulator [Corynebacterium crudilactis]